MPIFSYLLLILTSFLWGGNYVVSKTLTDHASPMTLTSLRWIIAVLCLLPIVWWKEKKIFPPRAALLPLFLTGVTGVVLFNLFQFLGLEKTSATNASLISTLNTISISIFSYIFLKERINILQSLSIGFSLFGVLLVLSKGDLNQIFNFRFNIGDLWMLTAVCMWGVFSVCSQWAMKHTSPMMSTLYSGIFGLIVLLPFNISHFIVLNINGSFIQSILYTGVISTVVCMILWNFGVKNVGATSSGLFLNLNPVFTTIWAFFSFGDQMTWNQGIGGGIVIVGCSLFAHFKNVTLRTQPI